jgi:Cu(I)/Ag(I) efflux system membrane protein CusA/SilA
MPEWMKAPFRHITPDRITTDELVEQMNAALKLPGLSNAWTMPIRGRIDMLTTGIRTPVGLKITGPNLTIIEDIGTQVEFQLASLKGTRSVFAERTSGGYFLDFTWNRDELARYGLTVNDAQSVVQNAIGGENVTRTIEGRERYPVNVRYLPDFRADIGSLGRVLVPVSGERQIPLSQLASIQPKSGPAMVRDEDGLLTGYVYVDLAGTDPQSYIHEARELLRDVIELPAGYSMAWSGQFEAMERSRQRLLLIVPVTAFMIVLLVYLNTRSWIKTSIVLLAVPFSAIGAVWFLWFLGYNMSVGVWVGMVALLGVDAETGVFMLLYLDLAYDEAKREGRMNTLGDLHAAIQQGAVKRLRPKFMTMATTAIGLIPVMWSAGTGADVMKRIAAPLIGGIFTSFLLELVVYPVIYEIWKWNTELQPRTDSASPMAAEGEAGHA